jgi:hypothetical protein
MTSPCLDPAIEIINAFIVGMRQAFDPTSECPPDGGGSTDVRFFAGDDARPAMLTPVTGSKNCKGPLLWVRAMHRHRSTVESFPEPFRANSGCDVSLFNVLAVEIGVSRCTNTDAVPKWEAVETEADISLDDSWRIERVLCVVAGRLGTKFRAVATNSVAPFGPDGGTVAWTGQAYIQI